MPERDLWTVVLGSAAVSQQLATVVAAVSVPVHLRLGYMTGTTLLLLNIMMLLIGRQHVTCSTVRHMQGTSCYLGLGDSSRVFCAPLLCCVCGNVVEAPLSVARLCRPNHCNCVTHGWQFDIAQALYACWRAHLTAAYTAAVSGLVHEQVQGVNATVLLTLRNLPNPLPQGEGASLCMHDLGEVFVQMFVQLTNLCCPLTCHVLLWSLQRTLSAECWASMYLVAHR